jgi:hypothetical protein
VPSDSERSDPDDRDVHEVLCHEPHLQLVPAKHVAHQEVVRAVVAAGGRSNDGIPHILDDDLVRLEEPGQQIFFQDAIAKQFMPRVDELFT